MYGYKIASRNTIKLMIFNLKPIYYFLILGITSGLYLVLINLRLFDFSKLLYFSVIPFTITLALWILFFLSAIRTKERHIIVSFAIFCFLSAGMLLLFFLLFSLLFIGPLH